MSTANDAVKAAPPPTLKRLLKRKLPTIVYYLRAVEPEVLAEAEKAVADAKEAQEIASFRLGEAGDKAMDAAAERLAEARKVLTACFEPVTVQALPPADYEALIAANKDEKAEDGIDSPAFSRAAFLACVQGDLSEAEWDEVLAQCSVGERAALFSTALAVNIRNTDGSVPKD